MNETPPDIEIEPQHWGIVYKVLARYLPEYEVWAFGSRARHSAKRYSDLDLAVITEQPLPLQRYAQVCDALAESDLPWRVDLLDWASTSERFREHVMRNHVVVKVAAEDGCESGKPRRDQFV